MIFHLPRGGLAALALCTALLAQVPSVSAPLDPAEANRRAVLPRWLSLKFAEFDTAGAAPAIPGALRAAPRRDDAADYFLVQIEGPVTEAAKNVLRARGLTLLDYVPNHAFVVRGTTAAVRDAVANGEARWSSPFHPAYRIDPELLPVTETVRIVVLGFHDVPTATVRAQVAAAGATIVEEHDAVDRTLLVATATPAVVRAIAHSADVQWVEAEGIVTERNDTMTWTVQSFVANSRSIWSRGLHGEGQVIGHMDGFIFQSSCYFSDPTNPIGQNHRKIVYVSGSGSASSHGTHTAGTAAGDPFPINGTTAGRGLAYAARLAHSSNYSASAWGTLAAAHTAAGARFHTNSWGNDGTTAYNSHCNVIDAFSWSNEDNLVFFAETNLSTLKNPENAKNLVAVGNAMNGASANSKCGGGVGPTADGRRKPDLFTPGCSLQSAHNTQACGLRTSTGTSMACPGATAASALIRQYFVDGFYPSGAANAADSLVPTGALLKAVLVNTCQDMTGVAGYPNDTEGWGRVNLDESLHFTGDSGRLWVEDVRRATGLSTGGQRIYRVDVLGSTRPLEVTLAFTDFAGTVNASDPVVNDLDLVVIAPNGTRYLGNAWSGGWSQGGTLLADAKNNVERAAIQSPAAGTWTFEVSARNVPQGPQGFGLCATGDLGGPFPLASIGGYGAGKPGQFGVPTITSTLPELPTTWRLQLGNSLPSSLALAVYGWAAAATPFDGGTLLLDPAELMVFFTGAQRTGELPLVLPADPALFGASTYWQVWVPSDPGASGMGFSATPGLRMTMGH